MRKAKENRKERGIALLTVLLFLLLLSALAVGLMYMSSTDTQINSNFRAEQGAYFAARAGLEEMRDRMATYNANTIYTQLPTVAPTTTSAASIIYLVNEGNKAGSVSPWSTSNAYMDTELCHEGFSGLGLSSLSPDVPCASVPSSGSYTKITSQLPFNGTSAAVPFKWVRLTLKQANSVQNYAVEQGNKTSTTLVCWNGSYELIMSGTSCSGMSPSTNPVYLITALAVTNTGGRKMEQAEVALQPSQPFLYGLFATGNGCSAVSLSGNVSTDSYTTANGGTYATTNTTTGGDVGAVGNVSANGSVSIGGSVGSVNYPASTGACPGNAFTTVGGAGMVSNSNNKVLSIPTITIPTPVIPSTSGPAESDPGTLSAGNYGDITIKHGTTTLSGGTYNVNSLTVSANGVLAVTGTVTINVQGSGNSTPVDLEGKGVSNPSGIAQNLQINYAGTGTLKITGGSTGYMVVDAPNGTVSIGGNSDIFGAIVGGTINNFGTAKFHYDKNTKSPVPVNAYYTLISFRELYY